ncbi:methyltransferase domain-containing protein [Streptomyces sp. NPDC002073]
MHATPHWDPAQYLRHAGHRARPFLELLARIPELPAGAPGAVPAGRDGGLPGGGPRIADLGCGPGNVTALLADRWPTARITGFDLSEDMLARARKEYAGPTPGGGSLDFRPADLTGWRPGAGTDAGSGAGPGTAPGPDSGSGADPGEEPYDLIVSNAALQWVPGHEELFAAWTAGLRPGGTFAFQVPGNFDAPSHRLLAALCDGPRWRARLSGHGERPAPVLEPAGYLARLGALGCAADVWETTYLQLLPGPDPVLDWVKGTALRPVLTALADDPQVADAFLAEYRDLLREAYPPGPHGTVFPFRRIFAVAVKEA